MGGRERVPASGTLHIRKRAPQPELPGDGWKTFDISITKHIPIKESVRAEFRVELFNAFNGTQFRHPNMRFGGGAFGLVTSQENEPRMIQLALKIHF